ncbi:HD domain-containing protein [Moritella dasanensis]|uniref:HD domain-containing protein n=1 Tax=Moritella dasanensis TaxID=428031 RepID=UPI0002DC1A3B|nr:ATP-binding protein [Moritella dasanensis]
MKIIERLEETCKENESTILPLYQLAVGLTQEISDHLKRVITVLTEFDNHDADHSNKVIENIEKLLGDEVIKKLSSYELFFIYMSSFLHDCGMAPSDWEIKLLKMTEGFGHFNNDSSSIHHDLKKPYSFSEAIRFIEDKEKILCGDFNTTIEWLFAANNKEEFIEDLASVFIDYQQFRNGYRDAITAIKNTDEFCKLNNEIRINFIRVNHHKRSEVYTKNLGSYFSTILGKNTWGNKIAKDLSCICRSHGENIEYLDTLKTDARYFGSETTNLQFVSMMLRLGDVIHFSSDRAPMSISRSKVYESEFSFQQWAIKEQGVNYSIDHGAISFNAYCENPDYYFKLHNYIDWIDSEIQHYFMYVRKWEDEYKFFLSEKVDRNAITNDEDTFLPMRGLSFKLNQRKIIELLMGVGLYKDKYSCLRELYQNSLDACRTLQSMISENNRKHHCKVEFGLCDKPEGIYLYCHDDGIGMSKNIIEKYLLNIGNSYYKSTDFYKEQADWQDNFSPTSQFGIGILSCFMIAEKIEIVTKKIEGEVISCVIDGPHENFYYKKSSRIDKELIGSSGTVVRILLKGDIANELGNDPIEKEYLFALGKMHDNGMLSKLDIVFNEKLAMWEKSLLKKVNDIVCQPFEYINVFVKDNDNNSSEIYGKPYMFKCKDEDALFVDNHFVKSRISMAAKPAFSEVSKDVESYNIKIDREQFNFNMVLILPRKNFKFNADAINIIPIIKKNNMAIDGVSVSSNLRLNSDFDNFEFLTGIGFLNFIGEERPQLSVDRISITSWPQGFDDKLRDFIPECIGLIINKVEEHINNHSIDIKSKECDLILNSLMSKFKSYNKELILKLIESKNLKNYMPNFLGLINKNISINELFYSSDLSFKSINNYKLDIITTDLIYNKLFSAENISVERDGTVKVTSKVSNRIVVIKNERFKDRCILFPADKWIVDDSQYDIISSILPIVPKKTCDVLKKHTFGKNKKEMYYETSCYSNGIAAFFEQDPLLIDESKGMYTVDENFYGERPSLVQNFERRRANFHLNELNSWENNNLDKTRNVLYIYISSRELTQAEILSLNEVEDEAYKKGVEEGWSILLTGMNDCNSTIKPGKHDRQKLVDLLPISFWDKHESKEFKFLDGTEMKISQ